MCIYTYNMYIYTHIFAWQAPQQYTASNPTSTPHEYTASSYVKPNQYTASVPKEDVTKIIMAPISTQRQAQPLRSISAKRGC